jgi:hypothetical protein
MIDSSISLDERIETKQPAIGRDDDRQNDRSGPPELPPEHGEIVSHYYYSRGNRGWRMDV